MRDSATELVCVGVCVCERLCVLCVRVRWLCVRVRVCVPLYLVVSPDVAFCVYVPV